MTDYYPPMGFHFLVYFKEATSKYSPDKDYWGFQSVSGLSSEVVTETYKEGGQNQYEYALPVKTQYPDLILKRGLYIPNLTRNDKGPKELLYWCQEMIESLRIKPTNIVIDLLSPVGVLLITWNVYRAWPKKWQVSDFNAEENQVVIETMEFHYDYFKVDYVYEGYANASITQGR